MTFYIYIRVSLIVAAIQTTQSITCDCRSSCYGTFRLVYDGEASAPFNIFINGSDVVSALNNMKTVASSSATVYNMSNRTICVTGSITNHSFVFRSHAGNLPPMQLWSAVYSTGATGDFDTSNSSVLTLSTADGRDDHVYECAGVGRCDRSTGECSCPYVSSRKVLYFSCPIPGPP